MSALSDFLKSGMDEALTVMGESCTVDGVSMNGVFSQIDQTVSMEEAGYNEGISLAVSVSKTDQAAKPGYLVAVVRGGVTYRVKTVEENDSGWVMGLIKDI